MAQSLVGRLYEDRAGARPHVSIQELETVFVALMQESLALVQSPLPSDPISSPTPDASRTSEFPAEYPMNAALSLLDALQHFRLPRSGTIYELLLRQCMLHGRPERAAQVYVGLIEEWILEGRLAEGGDLQEFAEGGLPAEEILEGMAVSREERMAGRATTKGDEGRRKFTRAQRRPSIASRMNQWFEGIRSWRLPGETIAPLDRIMLWHPKKLALREKMKNFPMPMPMSPPRMVPAPSVELLHIILRGLDFKTVAVDRGRGKMSRSVAVDPEQFERCARALAILANPVLSRTLPITALGKLLKAFRTLPDQPAVYPEKMANKQPSSSSRELDLEVYTAYTHCQQALYSLIMAPPSRMWSGTRGSPYRLQPMDMDAANSILAYALRVLKTQTHIDKLFSYITASFGLKQFTTATNNILLAFGRPARRVDVEADAVKQVSDVVPVKNTPLSLAKWKTYFQQSLIGPAQSAENIGRQALAVAEASDPFTYDSPPYIRNADDLYRFTAYVQHLAKTSDREKLGRLVNTLIPYLDTDSYAALSATASTDEMRREVASRTALARQAMNLPPRMYVVLLRVLQQAGKIGLAERVWHLAQQASETSVRLANRSTKKTAATGDVSARNASRCPPWFLPEHAYTTMLKMYDAERRKGAVGGHKTIKGWGIDAGFQAGSSPASAARAMTHRVYRQAVRAAHQARPAHEWHPATPTWLRTAYADFMGPPVLDDKLFHAYTMSLLRDRPTSEEELLVVSDRVLGDAIGDLQGVVQDMKRWRCRVPWIVKQRLAWLTAERTRRGQEQD